MILDNVFYTEIHLKIGNFDEFVDKGWNAFNMHKEFPNEEIGPNGFLDWARDLFWIKADHIIVVVKGALQEDTREMIEFLDKAWDKQWKNSKKPAYQKQVDFIIVPNDK